LNAEELSIPRGWTYW